MKKISIILSIVFALSIMQMFSVSSYAANKEPIKYNITFETLAKSEEAKEFNKKKNKKVFLDFLNKQAEWTITATGDDTYDYLTLEDLDFTDNTKVKGLKHHGLYTDRRAYADFDHVMSCLEDKGCSWVVVIKKDDTRYTFGIYQTDTPHEDDVLVYGDWYTHNCYVTKVEQKSYTDWYNSTSIISANLKRMLKEAGEEGTNIKFIYADIGDRWGGSYGIVFVNRTAKYIYSYGMAFPTTSANFREDTPQAVINLFNELSSELSSNSILSSDGIDDTEKTDRLYSYRVIMAMYELCDYYKK